MAKIEEPEAVPAPMAGQAQEAQPVGNRPWAGYDHSTVGEIMTRSSQLNDDGRKRVLAYERRNQKRDAIILPLVNWNS